MVAATLFPHGGGYAGLLHGKVVDMLYFPIFEGFLPKWFPVYGGDYFIFFRPVFNVADASITSGVILIILFQKTFFGQKDTAKPMDTNESMSESTNLDGGSEPPSLN